MKLKLTLEILFHKGVGRLFDHFGHVSFAKNAFWSVNRALTFY